jgi:uncharacterized protein (UPF0179 family)
VNEAVTWGIKGVPDPANTPGARHLAASWTDAGGNLYMLGGANGGSCSDLWRYNILTGDWVWIKGGNSAGVYGTLNVPSASNDPGAGYYRSGWKDNSGNFWLFGGVAYDVAGNNSHVNELWKTTLPVITPTANFTFNQTAQVCMGTRIKISDLSAGQAVAWTYSLDGVSWSNAQNPFLQNLPTVTLSAGVHTVSLLVANAAGYSAPFTQTINVLNSSVTNLTTTPSGSLNLYIGSGQTPNSDWAPWVFTFNDPLPAGAQITRVVLTYDAVDQGFGGTGVGAAMYLADTYLGEPALQHFWQPLSIDKEVSIPNYNNGGLNTFKMYFWGYPGWQAFIQNANMQIYYQTSTVSVCAGNTVTLSAIGASTYTWSNGAVNGVPHTPTASAIYTVNATSANGCVTSATEAVVYNPLPVISVNSGTICAGESFTIVPTGASTYTFINGATVVSPVTNTSYSVAGTSSAGCLSALPGISNLVVNPLPVISANSGAICVGGIHTITPSGASSYTFSGGSNTVSPAAYATYSVTGTSAAGCISSLAAIVAVTVNPLPVLAISGATAVCIGSAISESVSGASTYTWSTGANSALISVSPLSNTTYSVSGTDVNGCINMSFTSVTVNPLPVVAVNNGTICAGNVFTLLPSGAVTYTYSGGTGLVSPVVTTSYSVTGTSSLGCISPAAVSNVLVNPLPVLAFTGTTQVCEGSAITQTVSGASTYSWSNGSMTNTVLLSPGITTTYTVTGTSAAGCPATATRLVSVFARPIISVNSGTICSGNTFTIAPSGAVTYSFSGGSATVAPITNSTYSVTGTDAMGCISASPAVSSLVVNTSPTLSVNNGTTCAGDSFTIIPAGAATYTYSGGAAIVNPVVSSTYSVTGTSALGCISTNTIVSSVFVNPLPVLVITGTNQVCEGSVITQTVSGANTYAWSSGATTATVSLTPTVSTTFSVTGTSSAGCVSNSARFITVNARPVITVNSGTICSGNSFTMLPSGASTYTIAGGSNIVTPLANSSYTVAGTDVLGCVSASAATASVQVNLSPTVSVNSGTTCAGNAFTMVPSGASTYTLSSGSAIVNPTLSSTYSVTGTSALGCIATNTAISTVSVNPLPVLAITGPNAVCNGSSITQTVTGATTYSWSTGATASTLNINPVTATNYIVTGTNAITGCTSYATKFITVGTLPVVTVNSGNICAGGSFTLLPGGASTYTITNGTSTVSPIVSPLVNSSYYVTGTSSLGCVSTGSAVANILVNSPPAIVVNSGAICTGGTFVMVPSGAFTYTISGGTATVSPGATTSYSVTGTTVLGCVSASPAVATVTVNPIPVISAAGGSVCSGSSFTINPSGAFTYTISGGSNTVSPAGNTTYSVTGTSQAGCIASNTAVLTVSVVASPIVSVSGGTVCSGSPFVLNPSGAASYIYSGGSASVSPLLSTSYSVTGISAQGCASSNTAVATVTVFATPVVAANSGSICIGNSFTIQPSGAATYTITGGQYVVTPANTTTYLITGSSIAGCIASNSATTSVWVNAAPVVSITGAATVCEGAATTLSASGAGSYVWSNNSTLPAITVSPFASTVYSVTGTNGVCSGTTSISMIVNPLPTITVNSGTVCPSGSFVIIPSGALTYSFAGGNATVNPLTTTAYTVTGSDANGCSPQFPAVSTVSVLNLADLSVAGSTAVCIGSTATLSVSGASSYTWNTGAPGSSIVITPTANGIFTVKGTIGGCLDSLVIPITVNALPTISVSSSSPFLCLGEAANLLPEGASNYTWNTGSNSATLLITPTVTMQYTVSGTDLKGCMNFAVFTQSVSECTGIDPVSVNSGISIFPNPHYGEFFIEVTSQTTMTVLNTLGELVLKQEVFPGRNSIEMREQAKGLYFIQFLQNGRLFSTRMILQ